MQRSTEGELQESTRDNRHMNETMYPQDGNCGIMRKVRRERAGKIVTYRTVRALCKCEFTKLMYSPIHLRN